MGITQTTVGSTHPVTTLIYTLANVAANQDGTAVPATANGDVWVVPWDGHIIGIAAYANDAVTAGTVLFKPTVGGTEDADLGVTLDTTNTQALSAKVPAISVPFTANSQIGVVYDSSADFAPTTADVNVMLYVVFNEVRY